MPSWTLTGALAVLALAVTLGAHALGTARRELGTPRRPGDPALPVVVAPGAVETIAAWRARGVRGRRLVHFGRFLHFVAADSSVPARIATRPGTGRVLDDVLAAGATQRSYLWVAAALGLARSIDYVVPPASLDARLRDLGLGRGALPLSADADDLSRTLRAEPPRTTEPVLVSVNASWFDDATGGAIGDALRAQGLRADLVVVDLARDADDVTDAARGRAAAFAAGLLSGAAP